MAAKKVVRPKIVKRRVIDGYVHTYDKDDRACLDVENRERVVLVHDLRAYDASLHVGALGWTIPETSDGRKQVEVQFDCGKKLLVGSFAFERVVPESDAVVSAQVVERFRNTRFDIDPIVAETARTTWISMYYGTYLSLNETAYQGVGDQELYAFTFPSLRELAALKGEQHYPVKVGYSQNGSDGAVGRIRALILEQAAYPEKPEVLLICKTWNGRVLETQVHKKLRDQGRRLKHAVGKEWFHSSREELLEILGACEFPQLPEDRVVLGLDETLEEGFLAMSAGGAVLEAKMVPGQAAVSIGIRYSDSVADEEERGIQVDE